MVLKDETRFVRTHEGKLFLNNGTGNPVQLCACCQDEIWNKSKHSKYCKNCGRYIARLMIIFRDKVRRQTIRKLKEREFVLANFKKGKRLVKRKLSSSSPFFLNEKQVMKKLQEF